MYNSILPDFVKMLPERGFLANHYVIEAEKQRILIECSYPVDPGVKIDKIFVTHAHYDHILNMNEFQRQGAKVYIPEGDIPALKSSDLNVSFFFKKPSSFPDADEVVHDGDVFNLDKNLSLKAYSTPGHTEGGTVYLLINGNKPSVLFTGDTIIGMVVGRTDLPGGDNDKLAKSLIRVRNLMRELPETLPVCCGHGPVFTVKQILEGNFMISVLPEAL